MWCICDFLIRVGVNIIIRWSGGLRDDAGVKNTLTFVRADNVTNNWGDYWIPEWWDKDSSES